jgi:glycerol-3-phosphate dehydrogenase subunit C
MSREGSLDAPIRYPIAWKDDAFYDEKALDEEMRRVFDICHGCRRCFNLCDSFPRLFDLIDESETEDLESVKSDDFRPVIEACTLCDMCFMTKCPYVPPHPFSLDFPHLMLRYRAVNVKKGKAPFTPRQFAQTDRNGEMVRPIAPLANWASGKSNKVTRPAMEVTLGIDKNAELPKFHARTFMMADKNNPLVPNPSAPAAGKRKVALYATCFVNYNKPDTGMAARLVLNHIGVETHAVYPGCCGMPQLEQGNLERVATQAQKVSKELSALIDQGYDIVALTASCNLMLKFEWKLILPDDKNVKRVSEHVFDIAEYVVDIAKKEGLPEGLRPVTEGITIHLPCHSRAQNMGGKATELLKLIPKTPIEVIERCSGHGGTFGVMKKTHEVAKKNGQPVFRKAAEQAFGHIVSDCPLAAVHILNGAREVAAKQGKELPAKTSKHPIEIFALAYRLK